MEAQSQISRHASIVDAFSRTFKTLRVSLTEVCNLGCVYCVDSIPKWKEKRAESHVELIASIKALHRVLDLEVVRLTGGEPTIYRNLLPLVEEVSNLGVSVKMTTNGLLLSSLAEPLKRAGVKGINVSLDALDAVTFRKVARNNGLPKIIAGIDKAIEAGIEVKLNAVILKGWNEQEIVPLLEFAKARNISIRFLELMRMGHLFSEQFEELLVSQDEILATVAAHYSILELPRLKSSTANYWQLDNGFRFGIIANESEPFCGDCDRLRLDSKGNIYGCLSEKTPINILDCLHDASALERKLEGALLHKQPVRFKGSELTMMEIGG